MVSCVVVFVVYVFFGSKRAYKRTVDFFDFSGESDVFDYSDVDVSVCRLKDDLLVESGLEDYDNAAIACEGKVCSAVLCDGPINWI
jgi:hypothetical protein